MPEVKTGVIVPAVVVNPDKVASELFGITSFDTTHAEESPVLLVATTVKL